MAPSPSLIDTDILSELFKKNPMILAKASEYISIHRCLNISHISDADILVAAIAVINSLVLITNNTNHFSRIDGLLLDNWKV